MTGPSLAHRQRGTTLIGVLLIMTLMGLIAGLGIPQLHRQLQARALRADALALVALIRHARSISLSAHQPLTLCASPGGSQCATDQWQRMVLLDHTERQMAELVLDAPRRIIWQGAGHTLTFRPRWRRNFLNGTFLLCPALTPGLPGWHVIISRLGRPRLQRVTHDPGCTTTR